MSEFKDCMWAKIRLDQIYYKVLGRRKLCYVIYSFQYSQT